MEVTKVVNKRAEDYDVYIGRPTVFGNPFRIGEHGNRDEVIELFRDYFYQRLKADSSFAKAVSALKGKVLGCYCKPQPCHGDVIAEYLNKGE